MLRSFRLMMLMSLAICCVGCGSIRTEGKEVADYARQQGLLLAQESAKILGDKITHELLPGVAQKAQEGAEKALRQTIADRITNDPDLDQGTKDDLLLQLGGAGGIAGLLGVAFALLKAKAAAKLKKTLGTVLKAEAELPEESQKQLRSEMKSMGGDMSAIKETIAQAKQGP